MKQVLIELDDRTARELERIAPTAKRMRAEFIRLAIRRALDLALDRSTGDAYRRMPLEGGGHLDDRDGWDEENELAGAPRPTRARVAKPRKRAA